MAMQLCAQKQFGAKVRHNIWTSSFTALGVPYELRGATCEADERRRLGGLRGLVDLHGVLHQEAKLRVAISCSVSWMAWANSTR